MTSTERTPAPKSGLRKSRDLCRRIIRQSFTDLVSGNPVQRRAVINWINTRDFLTICERGDVDPKAIRKLIAELGLMPAEEAKRYLAALTARLQT